MAGKLSVTLIGTGILIRDQQKLILVQWT